MKRFAIILAAAAALGAVSTGESAAPSLGGGLGDAAGANPMVHDARVFCYNRYTGRFLHWGRCGGYRRPVYNRPRVYCYNRYSGRFLHWGRCRR